MTRAVRRIEPGEWREFRELRLRALADAPEAFATTYAESVAEPDGFWQQRVADCATSATSALFIGIEDGVWDALAGCFVEEQAGDHLIISMWCAPERRGTGLAEAVVRPVCELIRGAGNTPVLWVVENNGRALRFYERLGFVATGRVEPYPNDPAVLELEMRLLRRDLPS